MARTHVAGRLADGRAKTADQRHQEPVHRAAGHEHQRVDAPHHERRAGQQRADEYRQVTQRLRNHAATAGWPSAVIAQERSPLPAYDLAGVVAKPCSTRSFEPANRLTFCSMRGPKFCAGQIGQDVREYAKQRASSVLRTG